MTTTGWHAPDGLLQAFAEQPAALDDSTASSVEAHLIHCERCRERLRSTAAAQSLADGWDAIADRIDRPDVGLSERILERIGVGGGVARLLAATPGLRAAGVVSVALVAAGAATVSRVSDAEGPFLVLAPLTPLAMVAASFASAADPAAEAGLATPLYGVGLVLRRAVALLTVTFGLLAVATLALPDLGPSAAAWVLPAIALTVASFALATWLPTEVAVATLAVGWLATVSTVRWLAGADLSFAASPTFSMSGQLVSACIAAAAAAVLVARRDRFATLEVLR